MPLERLFLGRFPPFRFSVGESEIVAYDGSFEGFASWVFLGFGFSKWVSDISSD